VCVCVYVCVCMCVCWEEGGERRMCLHELGEREGGNGGRYILANKIENGWVWLLLAEYVDPGCSPWK